MILSKNAPINNAVSVEELQRADDFGGVETSTWLIEFTCTLDLEHQIASVHVFHHEDKTVLYK